MNQKAQAIALAIWNHLPEKNIEDIVNNYFPELNPKFEGIVLAIVAQCLVSWVVVSYEDVESFLLARMTP